MASSLACYRGTGREIEHNTRRLSRPLDLPVMAACGDRLFGAAGRFAGCGRWWIRTTEGVAAGYSLPALPT